MSIATNDQLHQVLDIPRATDLVEQAYSAEVASESASPAHINEQFNGIIAENFGNQDPGLSEMYHTIGNNLEHFRTMASGEQATEHSHYGTSSSIQTGSITEKITKISDTILRFFDGGR